ncbi:MAG: winged helix-turn-helix transcriptional regulator [Candidatus Freyarchaeum deiterrae]
MTSVAEIFVGKVEETELVENGEGKIVQLPQNGEDKIGHLPQSALVVVEILRKDGALTPKDIFQKTNFAPRTVRYALKTLLESNVIEKVPNLMDLRQNKYRLT